MGEYLYLNQEDKFIISKLNSINVKSREFELIMNVYNQALEQVFEQLEIIKNSYSGYFCLFHFTYRYYRHYF